MICNFGDVIVLIEIDECDSNLCGNGGTCNDYQWFNKLYMC